MPSALSRGPVPPASDLDLRRANSCPVLLTDRFISNHPPLQRTGLEAELPQKVRLQLKSQSTEETMNWGRTRRLLATVNAPAAGLALLMEAPAALAQDKTIDFTTSHWVPPRHPR